MSRFFVTEEFDSGLLASLDSFYDLIDEQSKLKDGRIDVIINSDGGYVDVLKSYLDAFDFAKNAGVIVATRVSGTAASCGSLLAIAGTPGYRTMSKDSYHYIHVGSAGATGRTSVAFDRWANYAKTHFEWVESQYRKYAKIPGLKKKLEHDSLFVNFEEALEWRLIDGE